MKSRELSSTVNEVNEMIVNEDLAEFTKEVEAAVKDAKKEMPSKEDIKKAFDDEVKVKDLVAKADDVDDKEQDDDEDDK